MPTLFLSTVHSTGLSDCQIVFRTLMGTTTSRNQRMQTGAGVNKELYVIESLLKSSS